MGSPTEAPLLGRTVVVRVSAHPVVLSVYQNFQRPVAPMGAAVAGSVLGDSTYT
jgi:tRNA A37 threonylcarbamoyladenosine synthetase subunit TsaC/SUA5/YrdC